MHTGVTVQGGCCHTLCLGARQSVREWMLWAEPKYNTRDSEGGQDVGTVMFLLLDQSLLTI